MAKELEEKILVLYKHPPTGEAIRGGLFDGGYGSEIVHSREEALEELDKSKHYFGIILENDVPEITRGLIKELKQREIICPVLLVTEYMVPDADLKKIYPNLIYYNGPIQYEDLFNIRKIFRNKMGMQGVEPRTP